MFNNISTLFFKDVPILHLIPSPFPQHWHQKGDNLENLNKNHIQDIRLIMKYFLMQILNVSINLWQ
jgi:glutaminyl-peptide cyclotransferase